MKKVTVSLGDRAYDILIGPGLLEEAVHYIAEGCSGQAMVVSDETVWRLHGMTWPAHLKQKTSPSTLSLYRRAREVSHCPSWQRR